MDRLDAAPFVGGLGVLWEDLGFCVEFRLCQIL